MFLKSDDIKQLAKNNKIVIFGAGVIAKNYVDFYNLDVEYYVDNNPKKWGTEYLQTKIKDPNFLIEDKKNIVVLVCSQYEDEISKQLNDLGYGKNINYFLPRDLEEKSIEDNCGTCECANINEKRILLDMSNLAWEDGNSPGISRLVKNLIKAAYSQNKIQIVAVQRAGENLYEPVKWLYENKIISKVENYNWNKIELNKNDILVLLDAIWGQYNKFKKVIEELHCKGGKVFNVICDIVPIEHPEISNAFITSKLKNMFIKSIENSDGIITISRTVAEDIISFIDKNAISVKNNFKLGYYYNGFSKSNFIDCNIENERIQATMNKKPYICVGTIEPKKGHVVALDAFEKLWSNNVDVSLCIIGRVGWMVGDLMERIKNHQQYGKKLFLIEQPSDNELAYCYENAEALVFPSFAEGFGLPLIEAASYKLPLILSDIPIFKEIAQENAIYFTSKNSDSLSKAIKKYIVLKSEKKIPKSENVKINTWEDSLEELLNVLDNNWYKMY